MKEEINVKKPEVGDVPMHMPEGTTKTVAEEVVPIANGPILLLLVALLLIVLGGMYYWYTILQNQASSNPTYTRPTADQNNEPESTTAEAQVEMIQVVSTSDEISAIEADLDSTNLDSLDAELNAIDAELNAN